jgi:hypothetical protein
MKFDAQGIQLQSGFGPPKDPVTSAFNLCPSSAGAERLFQENVWVWAAGNTEEFSKYF